MDTQHVYNFLDLQKWSESGVNFAVIVFPVTHSLSPVMMHAAFRAYALIDPNYSHAAFYKFDIAPDELGQAIRWFKKKKFLGLSITAPHKEKIKEHIEWVDEIAKVMGAINNIKLVNNEYHGYNTDGVGFENAIKYDFKIQLKGKDVVLLGAGGASKAVAMQCLLADVKSLWIGNRSQKPLEDMQRHLGAMSEHKTHLFLLSEIPADLPKDAILINGTSLGMRPNDPSPIKLEHFNEKTKVVDIIYRSGETRLLSDAKQRGMKYSDGLRMLVEQGAVSFRIWTQHEAPIDTMWDAIKHHRSPIYANA